jgi:O-antigen/teichoic acid export membrane protein
VIILVPLLAKTLGAHDYGIWVQVQVTVSLALELVGLGLPYAIVRFLAAKTDREEILEEFYSVFCLVFLTSLIASIALFIGADFIAEVFFDGATEIVKITALIILVWSLDWVCLNLFRAFLQMKKYSVFMLADALGQVVVIVYLVLNGYGLFSIVLAVLAIRVAIFFILFFLIKSQIGIKRPHFPRIKEYLNFGLPTIAGGIAGWVVDSGDRYVIAYFLGAGSVGVYSAGYALAGVLLMFIAPLTVVLGPTLSKFYDERRMSEVTTYLSYSLKYFLALAIPFVFGAAILAEPVLRLFSTAEIASQGYFVVPLVTLSILLMSISGLISHILVLVKKTRIMGLIWIIAAIVNLGLNIVIVPHLGILGAALTTLIAYSLVLSMVSYYSFKEFKFDIDWRFIIKSLIASAIMALVIWSMHPQGSLDTIIAVLVGVAVYGVAIFLLRGFTKEEISFFRGLFQRSGPTANPNDKTN